MPGESDNQGLSALHRGAQPRWFNTLALRLGVVVNVAVIAVLALSAWVDHRRDADMQIQHALSRLQEEARVLRAAWSQFRSAEQFQRFVDGFCRQMTASASAGHHIAVFDADGDVLVRAHERADPDFERRMSESAANRVRTFYLGGERFAAYSLGIGNGANLVVALSLRPVEEMLRTQGVARAAATGVLVVVLFGVTAICLLVWVRDPLHGFVRAVSAVSEHHFDQRVEPRGAAELRFLAEGINDMIRALRRSERKRALEMKRARGIQRALVGDRSLAVEGFQVEAVFLPAQSVGGDFFDIVPLGDGSTLVAVLDVTGHGVPGALCTALLRSSLRHLASATGDLAQIARGLNRELCNIAAADLFATAVLLRVRPDSGRFEYVIAGHDPPVLVDPDGRGETLEHADMILGVDPGTGYAVAESQMPPGGRMFLFTDGLHEAMSPRGEQFGRERISELFARTSQLPLEEQLSAALDAIRAFQKREDFDDDVTVLAICRDGTMVGDESSDANVALYGPKAMLRPSAAK